MENALVDDRVGFWMIRKRPGIISARSGIKNAAIKKKLLKTKKNSRRNERSDICFKVCKSRNLLCFAELSVLSHISCKKSRSLKKKSPAEIGRTEDRDTFMQFSFISPTALPDSPLPGFLLRESDTGADQQRPYRQRYCPELLAAGYLPAYYPR